MSYIGTLASCMLNRFEPSDDFITPNGSSHGADAFFPKELNSPRLENYRPPEPSEDEWDQWYADALRGYTRDGLCVIKDGWHKYGFERWRPRLNHIDSISVISAADDFTSWAYCWFNMVDKIPKHVYSRLRDKSKLWPKLWWKVRQDVRMKELIQAMPLYPIDEAPSTDRPCLRISAVDVIADHFPQALHDFLKSNGFDVRLNDDIKSFHAKFARRNQPNLQRARDLASGVKWKARGRFDEILFDWYERHHQAGVLSNRLRYLQSRSSFQRGDMGL